MKAGKEMYVFKRGCLYGLDEIYVVQGLADGDWWQPYESDKSDTVICVSSVRIIITYKKG